MNTSLTRRAPLVYDDLYGIYRDLHDRLSEETSEMRRLRAVQKKVRRIANA